MNRREEGQITVMVVGFFIVIGLLAVVVINASAAFLQRQELNNLADGAALAAADGLRRETIYREGIGVVSDAPLDGRAAQKLVSDYVGSSGARDVDRGLRWSVQTAHDRVTVTFSFRLDLPLVPPGWQAGSTVTSRATALLRVSGGP